MELCIYHGIKVQVEGLECEHISQMFRCTGSQSGHGGDQWNDCLWVKQAPGRCYGVQKWRLLWQLQRLLTIKRQHVDGAFINYLEGLGLTTILENSSNLDPFSKFEQVKKAPAAIALELF